MERVTARDAEAFDAVYDAFHRLVLGIALRMLDDLPSSEDLVQFVFLKIWMSSASFQSGDLAAWISRIARNRALDVLRHRATHAECEMPANEIALGSFEERVLECIDAERARAALRALPESQRLLLEAGFFSGFSHQEMARSFAIPLGTVKTRIRTGLRSLRSELSYAHP